MNTKWIGSVNKTKGRNGYQPQAIVIHVMEGTLTGTDAWFNNPKAKVSAHYGIGSTGSVHQYVAEMDTAWHAGRKSKPLWKAILPRLNPNLYTVGIEHEGTENSVWNETMINTSAQLIADISRRWGISLDRDHVVGHREIYSLKKCPGSVNLDFLVERAKAFVLDTDSYNLVAQAGSVRTKTDLNLRKGAPSTLAAIAALIPANSTVAYKAWTSNGLSVHGNSHWYLDANGNFFWAGATDHPIPGI